MARPPDRAADDDRDLVARATAGDRDALERLLARHVGRIHAVCRRLCGPQDAEDATQHALMAVVRAVDRFDGRAAFSTWVHRIATNAALDELRRRRRRPVPVEPVVEPPAPPAGAPERAIDRVDIDAALERLAPEFREAVVLRDVADLEYADIAELLAVPIGTVRSRIARGRAALADALGNPDRTADVQSPDHA